jgi:hypothetical protein
MNALDNSTTPESLDIESLLPTAPRDVNDTLQLDTLLPRLEFVSELLADAPALISGPSLVFRGRDNEVKVVPIGGTIHFGRADDCEIRYAQLREVSRHHFKIEAAEDQYILIDSGSSNGTFVRGNVERITKHTLRDGDIIEAAGFAFVFVRG